MLTQTLSSGEQIAFTDDVVTVKDAARLVPADGHADPNLSFRRHEFTPSVNS